MFCLWVFNITIYFVIISWELLLAVIKYSTSKYFLQAKNFDLVLLVIEQNEGYFKPKWITFQENHFQNT